MHLNARNLFRGLLEQRLTIESCEPVYLILELLVAIQVHLNGMVKEGFHTFATIAIFLAKQRKARKVWLCFQASYEYKNRCNDSGCNPPRGVISEVRLPMSEDHLGTALQAPKVYSTPSNVLQVQVTARCTE